MSRNARTLASARRLRSIRPGLLAVLIAGLGQTGTASTAEAPYRLAPGDIVEVAVAGLPELRQRYTVQMDGTIVVPMAGLVPADGATTPEVASRIEALLARRVLRQRVSDGRERPVVIEAGDVAVSVAEYRPIFVRGDVPAPGQYAFRPQMTVRYALALSGGSPPGRNRNAGAALENIDIEREYRVLTLQFAKEQVHAWRIAAELDGADAIKERPISVVKVAPAVVAALIRAETSALKIALAEHSKQADYLATAIRQAEEQIRVLAMQEQEEQRGVQADVEELDRTNRLFGSGSLTSQRVAENRRAVLLSSTRRLQTAASLSEAKQRREEYLWRRQQLDVQRQGGLLRDQRETLARASEIQIRLEGVAEKLSLMGQPVGVAERTLAVSIVRRTSNGVEAIPATLDTELQPGDGVEVMSPSDTGSLVD